MIIYDPKITGSFDVNGTSISSLDQIDVTSGSVSSLNDATSSYALIAEISGSTTSLSSSLEGRVSDNETSVSSLNSASSSYALETLVSGSFTATSSSLASELLKNTTDTLTGDLTVTGTVTAQEFHTEYISASITYESGSHKFGDSYDDVHEFTGSVNVSNSLNGVSGSYTFTGGNFTIEGDDADINLNITSGSALANLTEFRFQTDGGTMGRLYMHKGTKHMYLGPTYFPTSSLFLQDGTGTVMSITGSSVGIGTSAPETELDILGPTQDQLRLRTAGSEHYRIGRDNSDGLLYFYGSQTGYTGYVFDGVDGERMRIASDGKVTITGDSNSTAHLKFATVSGGSTNSYIGNFAGDLYLSTNYYYDGGHNSDTASRRSMEYFMSDDNIYISTMPAGSPGSRTRLLAISGSAGCVGIGTANPRAKLDINVASGSIATTLASSVTYAGLYLNADAANGSNNIRIGESGAGSYYMQVSNSAGTTPYAINLNPFGGNIGIGNTNPLGKLQITTGDSGASSAWTNADELILESSGNAGLAFQTPNTGAATIAFQDPESVQAGFIQYLHGDNLMRFATNGNNIRAVIDSGGNVGIGTTSPIYRLHVNSGTQAARFTAGDGGYAAVTFDGDAGNTIGSLTTHNGLVYLGSINSSGTGANGEIRIEPFGGNVMTLDSGGNVGIGNQDPFHKLSVSGDSYFSDQLRVDQPVVSWSDSGTKHYTHLATFSGYGSAASALIINTNIPGHNQSGNGNMFTFRIVGYSYGSTGLIDMLVGCYAGENNYYSAWWTGTCQTNWVDNVYVYTNSSGKVAFQIGETTDTLAAEIAITDFVQGFGNVNTSYADSWSCQAVTTLPTQTNKVTLGYKRIIPDVYEDVTFHDSVGIGTTSITKRLEVAAESNTDGIRIQGSNANATLTIQNNGTGGNAWDISSTGAGHGYGNGNLIFGVTFSPKVTFKSDGYILNGGHAANDGVSPTLNGWGLHPNGTATAVCNFSDTNEMVVLNQRDGSGTTQFEFRNGNVERGRIEWTTSGTTYNTNSDYRLKENVTNLTGSLAKVDQLEPKAFNFISDPDEPKIGFIAHEVQDIVPQAVSGVKDAVREDGTPKYQGLDHSMLVPLLVGAIKELKADNEALKARIETLENS